MRRSVTRAAPALVVVLAWATVVACSSTSGEAAGADAPAPSAPPSVTSGTDAPAAPGTTAGTAPPAVAPREGRYVEELYEIEQVVDDAVFRTAAEAPGFGREAKDLLIDVWVPVGDELAVRPLMIFQFGGGFRTGDRNQLRSLAEAAARRGFVTAAFDYRTGPGGWQQEGLLDGVRDDAKAAVAWLVDRADELGFDPDAIISTGASAGAVNSLHLIVEEPDQDDVVLAGAVSLSGAALTLTPPPPGGPPIIMFSGTQDTVVPYRLQTRFCEQYVAAGNVCEQHSYEAGHMGGDQADIRAKSVAFVREQILRPLGY